MSLEVAVRSVRDRDSLLALLRDELGWRLPDRSEWSELTFEWHANELRVSESAAQRLQDGRVYQLRPFHEQQPWGIFFVIFDRPRISITTLRQTLRGLVSQRRQASRLPSWNLENLLFICTTSDYDRFTFAHFRGEKAHRAVLTTFGWERGETALHTLCKYNLENLRFPDDPSDTESWLTQWRAAFDVQAVTDAFFRDYEKVFDTLQRQLYQQTNDKVWAHDYALQVLNRLMFLYFIQRKTTPDGRYWLGDDRRFIKGGSVEILELGGVTVYTKTVTLNEEFLPAAPVYRGVYATGNSTGAALQLEVLQAHLHPAPTGGALLPQDQAGRHLPGAHRLA